MARGVFQVSEERISGVPRGSKLWYGSPDSPREYISTQTDMEGWAYSIQAFIEQQPLSDWVRKHSQTSAQDPVPYLHEILHVNDDPWAHKWAGIIQQITLDYNDIRSDKAYISPGLLDRHKLWSDLARMLYRDNTHRKFFK